MRSSSAKHGFYLPPVAQSHLFIYYFAFRFKSIHTEAIRCNYDVEFGTDIILFWSTLGYHRSVDHCQFVSDTSVDLFFSCLFMLDFCCFFQRVFNTLCSELDSLFSLHFSYVVLKL